MSKSRYVHLHCHSHYSLLDGVIPVGSLVRAAKDRDMKAIALTDHGNMFGAVEFYQAAKQEGIKPIIGMEAYITEGSRLEKKKASPGANFYHLVLLAQNAIGYQNLVKLSSMAFIDGFYYKPRIDHEILEQHSEGLIGLSACLSSEINRALLHGDDQKARDATARYQRIFGKDRFFLEIQEHGLPEQRRILEKVPPLAQEFGLPLVATNDIHYLNPGDARAQEIHLCINTGATLDDADRMCFDTDQFYFREGDEMARIFSDFPDSVTNTDDIADMIDFDLDMDSDHLPVFQSAEIPRTPDMTSEEVEEQNRVYLRELLEQGFAERYAEETPELRERLEYEIGIIEKMGFVSYFLITWDFIRFARDHDIPVGPGRGSAVGSIVAYCLGITDMDPIEYGLIFERFLNSDRISMPDIDIDFCMDGRDKVIQYVRDKYGEDRVCQIVTFGTMAARAVIRDVGRVLGIPLKEIDAIAKKIPDTIGIKLDEALAQEPDLRAMAEDPRYQELFEVAQRLEGLNRHCSTHAAGVVIADQPLTEIVPLYRNGDDITTQYTMEVLERLGLLKMDFLGLKTLTIIDRARKIIREEQGIDIDPRELALDDPKTYELLQAATTKGIFQLESQGMRELLRRMVPDRFDDLIAVLALYRPGPLGSGMDKTFCERKHGREELTYLHDKLAPILGESNGVILYQEQVMRIAHDMAGFSMNEADSLRKAMGKKKPEILAKFKDQFCKGAAANDIEVKTAKEIFEQIEHFAKYGFNKSHSTAYAVVSYQTAYLKANYPAAFLAAVLSCEIALVEKMVEYLDECRQMGIVVHPPNINTSGNNFTVRDGEIHYGLVAIKGVGEKAVEAIVSERSANGEFTSIYDLTTRVDLRQVNKTTLEQLVRCGALDTVAPQPGLGARAILLASVKDAIDEGNRVQAERRAGQLSLFGGESSLAMPEESYAAVPEWSDLDVLAAEKESLGFYLSGHPLQKFEADLAPFRTHDIQSLDQAADKSKAVVGVLISKVRLRQTKRGDTMAILHVEDQSAQTEVVVFPNVYREQQPHLADDAVVLISGDIEVREETAQLRANKVIPVEKAFEEFGGRLGVTFPVETCSEDDLFRLKDVVQRHPGKIPVSLVFRGSGRRWVVRTNHKLAVSPTSIMLEELRALFGDERVLVHRG